MEEKLWGGRLKTELGTFVSNNVSNDWKLLYKFTYNKRIRRLSFDLIHYNMSGYRVGTGVPFIVTIKDGVETLVYNHDYSRDNTETPEHHIITLPDYEELYIGIIDYWMTGHYAHSFENNNVNQIYIKSEAKTYTRTSYSSYTKFYNIKYF